MGYIYKLISKSPSNYPDILGVYYDTEQTELLGKDVYVGNDLSRVYVLTASGDDNADFGDNLIIDGTFQTNLLLMFWGVGEGGSISVSDNKLNYYMSGDMYPAYYYPDILEVGKPYYFKIEYVINAPDSEISIFGFDQSERYTEGGEHSFIANATYEGFNITPHSRNGNTDISISNIECRGLAINYMNLCIAEYFEVEDILETIINLTVSTNCGSGCSTNCKTDTYILSVLLCAGLESARIYHEKGDTSKRDEILEKLRAIIATQTISSNEGASVQVDLSTYELNFAKQIYKYSLSELYNISCCNSDLKSLVSRYMILKTLDMNNALQYLSEASVDCLVSKLKINNCNC